MSNRDKTVLVTGATGGIGKAVCAELAEQGYSLVLAARNTERLAKACDDLAKGRQGTFSFIPVDMSDQPSIDAFAESLRKLKLTLHGAIIMPPQIPRTEDCLPPADTWSAIFKGSFIGPLEILRHAIAAMNPRPADGVRAKVVIVSGVSSAQVLENYATSNALRNVWIGEAKSLAFAYGEKGIHVNTLSLGGTLTEAYQAAVAERARKANITYEQRLAEETANVPLKKYGTPQEVARVVASLLGSFSDHMTGQNILHEGGFVKRY